MTETEFTPMSAGVGQWWRQHAQEPPTVILRCGRNGCGDRVGEIKTDGTTTLVLREQKIGEIPVPGPRMSAANEEELKRLIAERDAQMLRRTDDGYVVPRRRQWPPAVGPLDALGFVMCPTHGKLDVPKAAITDLVQFVADTQRGSRRVYLIFRGA